MARCRPSLHAAAGCAHRAAAAVRPVVPAPPVSGISCFNTLNGSSSTQYIGTIYTPTADWKINGGNRSPLAGQVIAYTATLKGGASVGIDFNPNYAPAPPAARLIN